MKTLKENAFIVLVSTILVSGIVPCYGQADGNKGTLNSGTKATGRTLTASQSSYSTMIGGATAYCIAEKGLSVELREGSIPLVEDVLAIKDQTLPVILINSKPFRDHPDWFQAFLFYRECGLHRLGKVHAMSASPTPQYSKDTIIEADCFAIQATTMLLRQKLPDTNLPRLVRDKLEQSEGSRYPTSLSQFRKCMDKKAA